MELVEIFLSLSVVKIIAAPILLTLFKSLWDFTVKRKERLRNDYNFAEQFVANDRWKDMSDRSLERAYEALSGIRVKGFVIRFFLSQKHSLEELSDYATGKYFLIANKRNERLVNIKIQGNFIWQAYNAFKMRPQKEEILDYLNDKKDELAQQFNVTTLGLFGSYALGQQTEDSDIDLLIEFAPQTEDLLEKKTKIKEMIRSEFYKEVDLCREKYIKPYFRKQILASVIYV